jgi:hypothetical protein
MSADEWTEAYRNAWKSFYGKENLTNILARWNHNPSVYWNLIFLYLWYKNAALIEGEHPMIAGCFRLKDRRSRRPGFAIDPWPVHVWKRAKDLVRLAWSWIRFFKEMEEIWLQTRPRSDRERQFVEEIERIQGEIWQTLKIPEWQKAYDDAKTALPAKARALLDPFEDLTSKILLSPKDLDAFLKKWGSLQSRMQELYRRVAGDQGPARRWLDHLSALQKEAWHKPKVQEWREAYAGFRDRLPSKLQLMFVKFDALSNRVVYSRQDLRRVWVRSWEHLRGKRFWGIRPSHLAVACVKEVFLTAAFTLRVISSFQPKY